MGHECHNSCSQSSCSQGSSSHGCCSHEHSQCGSNGACCGCKNCHCSCHSSCHGQGKYADELLHLADDAWMDILKDKIKEEIRLNSGEQLTNLAKLIATANHARWKDKMQSKKDHEDFETQLKNAMCCGSQKK